MENVSKFDTLMEQVSRGADPALLAEMETGGGERKDDISTPEQKVAAFRRFTDELSNGLPYIDKGYIEGIASQLRSGASASELSTMLYKNREQYAGKANVPGSVDIGFDTYDVAWRALNAAYTDHPPSA